MRSKLVVLVLALALSACRRDAASEHLSQSSEHDHGTAAQATTAPATDTAAPAPGPTAELPKVTFGEASGFLATPTSGPAKKPALIVIQEWWGVDDYIKRETARFAEQGYVALAVDLYRGKVTASMEEAHELSRGLPEDRAMGDLKAAFDYLASREDVDPQRIGVIGWCLGGGYALALATQEPRLKATVINYGRLITEPGTIAKINGPVLGNFGDQDRGIPVDDVKKFSAALTAAGKPGDVKIHEGAGHAFMNPNNKQGYNAAAAQDAQGRIDRFFDQTLRANISNS
ncbi:MAG TPA: dienelactone hydrolase family protein [Thermoanaerobaculia bacterium]|nr:dienelactone hydrolase family protein [Thermoanaerobaculia bacterium]